MCVYIYIYISYINLRRQDHEVPAAEQRLPAPQGYDMIHIYIYMIHYI